ncbi:MAG: biotin/lipoyl-binding protein, partial [Candidatus Margulisiibacteriota bacterium]
MKNRLMIVGIVVAVLIVIGYGVFFAMRLLKGGIVGSGTIEVTEVVISSKVTGRITQLNVDEGSDVTSGEVLALVETQDYQAALDKARAQYKLAFTEYNR